MARKSVSATRIETPRQAAIRSGLSGDAALSAAMSWEAPVTSAKVESPSIRVGPSRMHLDSIINLMAGAGTQYDKARATQWAFAATENWQSLTNLARASWLARKIITCRYDDMLRGGVLLDWDRATKGNGATEKLASQRDQLKSAITRWSLFPKLREALYYKGLYGGSIIVVGINGTGERADLTQPLPIKDGAVDYSVIGKGGLRYLHVFDRWRCQNNGIIDTDLGSPNCGKPMYHILTDIGASELMGQQVHWSRVIRFDGAWVPWVTWRGNGMWMDSELQSTLDTLKTYDSVTSAIASLIFEANIDVIKSTNLVKNLADADGEQAVQTRYLHAATQKSNYRMLLIDKDAEDYQRYPFQFSGLDRIWEKVMLDVSGCSGIPVCRLFGQSPAGLNATGASDMQNYNQTTASVREMDLRPRLKSLIDILAINEFGQVPPGLELTFPPLGEPTPLEKSQIDQNRANRDKLYVDMGAATPGLIMREAKEDGIFRTAEDEDVAMAEELDRPPPGGFGGGEPGVPKPPVPPLGGKSASEKPSEKGDEDDESEAA